MKKYGLLLAFIVSIAFLLSSCNSLPTETSPAPTQPSSQPSETAEQVAEDPHIEIVFLDNPQESNNTDVYLQDMGTKEMQFFATISDINLQHYHPYEYHNGNLYIIRRKGDYQESDDWTDELWKYYGPGEGSMLYSIKGLDFRVSPDEEYIALTGGDQFVGEKMVVLDVQENTEQEFAADQLVSGPAFLVGHLEWSDDGSELWIESGGPGLFSFCRLNVTSWQIDIYDITETPITRAEYELNTNTGKLVFSDYPVFFDADSADQFKESQTDVTLFVYDLVTRNLQQIAVSKAKEFDPLWLDVTTIEYNDPGGDGRTTSTVQP